LLQKLDSLPTPQSPDEIFMEQYQGGHKGIDNILPSPDGKYILSSASPRSIEASNSIQVWDAKNGKRILDFDRHVTKGYSPNHGVAAMLFLSDLKTVLTAAGDNVIRL
jgi:WD40 repeat protein